MKARLMMLASIAYAFIGLAPAWSQDLGPHALCPPSGAVPAERPLKSVEIERNAVSVIAASTLGACSCREPLEADGTCPTRDAETRSCAASVIDRVGQAAILALRHGADQERMAALKTCLVEARLQLEGGREALDEKSGDWAARRAIGLAVSKRLIAEFDHEAGILDDHSLESGIRSWLETELERRRRAFRERYPTLGEGDAQCPHLSDTEAWKALLERDQVNCMLKAIAAARADNTDFEYPKVGSDREPSRQQFCQPQEGGGIDPTCCMASLAQIAGEEHLGAYEFSWNKETSFRASMTEFCARADAAGLLAAERRSHVEAAELDSEAALKALREGQTLTPAQIRVWLAPLIGSEARARWSAAQEKSEAYEQVSAAQIDAELGKLAAYFSPYLEASNGREYLLGGLNRELTEFMLRHHACFEKTGAACQDEGAAQ